MPKQKIILFWKAALILLGLISLSTGIVKTPGFWTSYMLDIAAPAWIYILLRGIYNPKNTGPIPVKLSPEKVLLLVVAISFLIETAQYLNLYDSTFDPLDFAAYISLLIPVYIIDKLTLD